MEQARTPQTPRRDAVAVDSLLRQGDARWADRTPRWREHQLVLPWPEELLSQFSLRMASHGMSISRTHMLGNPGYALQQLVHARAMGDDTLLMLASQLFRFYQSHQSGVAVTAH
jgi:hypothetical protein